MLQKLLNDHQTGMSLFQDDYLVTNRAGGTLYGSYKQALREVYKRFRGLRQQTASRERLLIDIDEAEYKIEHHPDDFEKRRAKVDFNEKTLLLEESSRAIDDTYREFCNFYRQAAYLKEKIGDFDDNRRNELDKDMWIFKIKEMACIDFITTSRLRNSTFEFIHACPNDVKLKILDEIKDHGKLINWYESQDCHIDIPDSFRVVLPEPDEIKYIG